MRLQGRDWAPLIVLAVAVSAALAGTGFLGGYTVGYAQHKPMAAAATPTPTSTPRESPSPTPTPPTSTPSPTLTAVQCPLADFPFYPRSVPVAAPAQCAGAWHVDTPASKVADYFASGAGQKAWQFRLTSAVSWQWVFRMSRAPSCRGFLTVRVDPAGGTHYEAIPDSQ